MSPHATCAAAAAIMLLLACCPSTLATDLISTAACDGPISPALFRFQWAYKVPDGSDLTRLDELVKQWMAGCKEVVRYGQGPAVTTDPAALGFTSGLPPTATIGDYGAYSDWVSLRGLKACYDFGRASGLLAEIRTFNAGAARVVFPLKPGGNPALNCPKSLRSKRYTPATVRYMVFFNFTTPDAASVARTTNLDKAITTVNPIYVRGGRGGDAVFDDAATYGAGATAADFGIYIDALTLADITTITTDPDSLCNRLGIRNLSTSNFRVAIDLPATAPTPGRLGGK